MRCAPPLCRCRPDALPSHTHPHHEKLNTKRRGGAQVEGLVCDRGLTLGHLIGVLHEFFSRLGLKKLRFKPAYNPYTEPSMEIFRRAACCRSFRVSGWGVGGERQCAWRSGKGQRLNKGRRRLFCLEGRREQGATTALLCWPRAHSSTPPPAARMPSPR